MSSFQAHEQSEADSVSNGKPQVSDVESLGTATKDRQNGCSLNRGDCLVSVPELLSTEVNCTDLVCLLEISQIAKAWLRGPLPSFIYRRKIT